MEVPTSSAFIVANVRFEPISSVKGNTTAQLRPAISLIGVQTTAGCVKSEQMSKGRTGPWHSYVLSTFRSTAFGLPISATLDLTCYDSKRIAYDCARFSVTLLYGLGCTLDPKI